MARQWDEDGEIGIPENEMALLIAIWAASEALDRCAATLRRLGRVVSRSERRSETVTGPIVRPALTHMFCSAENAGRDATACTLDDEPPSRPT